MKSLIIIPQSMSHKRMNILNIFSSFGDIVFKKKYRHDSVDEIRGFFKALLNSIQIEKDLKSDFDPFKNKKSQIEFVLFDVSKSNIDKLLANYPELFKVFSKKIIENPNLILGDFAIVIIENVEEMASKLFWKICLSPKIFHSNNKKLFEYEYFPTLIAKDGDGIFFDERIVDRLEKLNIISERDEVISIRDYGGWETLDNLIAEVEVKVKSLSKYTKISLYGEALVPAPPITPESLCNNIIARKLFLEKFGILSSVIEAGKGVVYYRGKNVPIKEYLNVGEDKNLVNIVTQLAELASIVDNRFFANEFDITELTDKKIFEDYMEIVDLNFSIFPSFLDALETDSEKVFWKDLKRAPNKYYNPQNQNSSLEQLLKFTNNKYHKIINSVYFNVKCLSLTDWLNMIKKKS